MAFRVVFFGTPDFACYSLRALLQSGATLAGVVSAAAKPRGRAMKVTPTPVAALAQEAGIPVLATDDIHAASNMARLRAWQANVFVVVAYGQIVKQEVLDMPPLGCVNVHPSLLPAYRGAAPIQRAIMDGCGKTGVCIVKMTKKVDAGDLLACQEIAIEPSDTFGTMHEKLGKAGAELLGEAIKDLAAGRNRGKPQQGTATYARKIQKAEQAIPWAEPAARIRDLIRAMDPMPGTHATWVQAGESLPVKIWEAQVQVGRTKAEPGHVLTAGSEGIAVACGKDSLRITQIQSPGKKRMSVGEWLRGHAVAAGDHFEGR